MGPSRSLQSGMTLAELLVAMTISTIIVIAAYAIFRTHHIIAMKQEETTLMQQELLAATAQIAEELRMCGYSPTGSSDFGFAHRPGIGAPDYGRVTNGNGIYCTLDGQGDGTIDETGSGSSADHIGFRLNVRDNGAPRSPADNVLRKFDTGAVKWQPFCTNIGELSFIYRDREGGIIADPENGTSDIRMVELRVTAVPSSDREHLGVANRTMTTAVWCRNLRGPTR